MVINTGEFKKVCSYILQAVDNNDVSYLKETMEIKSEGHSLYLNVTNSEYYVSAKFDMECDVDFKATIKADVFLRLISQMTTETISLEVDDKALHIKGNGNYTFPLIYNDDVLLELPEITIDNVTGDMDIDTSILKSILTYNTKEILKGKVALPIQKLYYIDEKGAITFNTGACVNNFTLPQPIKLLLNTKVVKLFKLFDSNVVHMSVGFDEVATGIIQTKVRFSNDDITLTYILASDESLFAGIPVQAIRDRANNMYPYSITLDKNEVTQTINRLMLFVDDKFGAYYKFEFGADSFTISDDKEVNKEIIKYAGPSIDISEPYSTILDLNDVKATIDGCTESHITMNFGDHEAFVVTRGKVQNVLPECSTF